MLFTFRMISSWRWLYFFSFSEHLGRRKVKIQEDSCAAISVNRRNFLKCSSISGIRRFINLVL